MPKWLLQVSIVDGWLPPLLWAITSLCAIALIVRRPSWSWWPRAVAGMTIGGGIGVVALVWARTTNAFGVPVSYAVFAWGGLTMMLIGFAVTNFWRSRLWRKIVAALFIPLMVFSAVIGISSIFGIDRDLGALIGVSTVEALEDLGGAGDASRPTSTGPLYARWTPPADMPSTGKVGLLTGASAIPSTAGFVPRDASIYLPPAAQVADAPALPLAVMMMGQPGNPDPSFIANALDELARQNNGLAPIVIVVDQLGNPTQDPRCIDSATFGGVATYVNHDVVAYASRKLNVLQDHRYWTIAGYSNGGGCAFTWGAQHPDIWGNVVSISGEEFAGSEDPEATTNLLFGGESAAFEASKPAAWLVKNKGEFAGHVAVFTAGGNDPGYVAAAERCTDLAQAAGFAATLSIVPRAGHVVDAIQGGLPRAFDVLYPHLGLRAP